MKRKIKVGGLEVPRTKVGGGLAVGSVVGWLCEGHNGRSKALLGRKDGNGGIEKKLMVQEICSC